MQLADASVMHGDLSEAAIRDDGAFGFLEPGFVDKQLLVAIRKASGAWAIWC
jgi:hypothetical protein